MAVSSTKFLGTFTPPAVNVGPLRSASGSWLDIRLDGRPSPLEPRRQPPEKRSWRFLEVVLYVVWLPVSSGFWTLYFIEGCHRRSVFPLTEEREPSPFQTPLPQLPPAFV